MFILNKHFDLAVGIWVTQNERRRGRML